MLFRRGRPIGSRQLVGDGLDLVLDREHCEARRRDQYQPEKCGELDHAACRCCWSLTARRRAARVGRRCVPPRAAAPLALADCGRFPRCHLGLSARRMQQAGSSALQPWREPARGARCEAPIAAPPQEALTRRSSSEWKARWPPPARHQQPFGRGEPAIELAELVVDRDPQRLEGAGRRVEPGLALAATAARTILASSMVRPIGWRRRAAAIERAIGAQSALRRIRGSAERDRSRRESRPNRRRSAPSRLMRMSSGPSTRTRTRVPAVSSWIEETPRSRAIPAIGAGVISRASSSRSMSPKFPSMMVSRPPWARPARGRAAPHRDRDRSRRHGN